ncbi:MAG: NAD(P)H-hydrate dehydratase [Firmicutes bacterium]|nr:NAD(P)H-hydrate dehydratase [Bacillota bacterium]
MLLTTHQQMRALDRRLQEAGVAQEALMEAVACAVQTEAERILLGSSGPRPVRRERAPMRVAVVAAKGHNGADGVAAARRLQACGHDCTVYLTGPVDAASAALRAQLRAFAAVGGRIVSGDARAPGAPGETIAQLATCDLVIDAMLGSGAALPLRAELAAWVQAINASARPVLAIDVPTGIDGDTGAVPGSAVRATCTVACGYARIGLFQHPARAHAGDVVLASLGAPVGWARDAGANCALETLESARELLPVRPLDGHKGTFGRVAVIAGSPGLYGAARLTAQGAARAGCGLVTVVGGSHWPQAAVLSLPDVATYLPALGPSGAEVPYATVEWARAAGQMLAHMQAAVCGPGLGPALVAAAAREPEVLLAFAGVPAPLVLDADFLTALAQNSSVLRRFFAARAGATVITPHPKEFARLAAALQPGGESAAAGGSAAVSTQAVQADRVRFASQLAQSVAATVVLKGAGTTIASPAGCVWICPRGNSGLATGGSGDVLAGVVAGLLASGMEATAAARLAVYLHGLAAELACATPQASEDSLVASDLPDWIGRAWRYMRE